MERQVRHPDGRVEELTGELPAARRMTMPCRWGEGGLAGFAGRVRFRRRFGYPGRIDVHERVWLTCAGIEGTAEVRLNGHSFGKISKGSFEFEITSLLEQRNLLEIDIEVGGDQVGLWGEVALEIRCTAFMRHVRARWQPGDPRVQVHGEVTGACEGLLELYALLNGRNAGYQTIEARQESQPFDLDLDIPHGLVPTVVRLELVHGTSVWYGVEVPVETESKGDYH